MNKKDWIAVTIIGVLVITCGIKGLDYDVDKIFLHDGLVRSANNFIDFISTIFVLIGLLIVFIGGRNFFAIIKEDKKKLD